MDIRISHEHLDLTDAIKEYAQDKIGTLDHFMPNLLKVDVRLGTTTSHHRKGKIFECKVNLTYPGGMFRAEKVSDDLYKAINEAVDVLVIEVEKYKEKHRNH